MSEEQLQKGFRVTGRVQGVGFRWWTKNTADELSVRGTVKNLPDGSVEVHARAEPDVMEVFAGKLEEGPWPARVEQVESIPSETDLPRGFEIRR